VLYLKGSNYIAVTCGVCMCEGLVPNGFFGIKNPDASSPHHKHIWAPGREL
jgi:hypothetical protein